MAEIDMVNHPPHYTAGKYETIDIIEDTTWGYRLATAFKYLHRCEYKGKKKEDLRKAVWFILREIDSIPDDIIMYPEDTEYDMVCLICKHFKSVLNKDLTCIDCLYPQGGNIDSISDDEPFNPIKDLVEDLYDGCYDFLCKGCNNPTAIVDSNWLCGACHVNDEPTKTSIGDSDNPYMAQQND